MQKSKRKSNAGRPTVMTPEVVNKLEQAFSLGCPITVACEYAGISKETIYDYIRKNPEYSDRIKQLQGLIGMRARKSIADAINRGDAKISLEYLKKKNSDEFGDKVTHCPEEKRIRQRSSPSLWRRLKPFGVLVITISDKARLSPLYISANEM